MRAVGALIGLVCLVGACAATQEGPRTNSDKLYEAIAGNSGHFVAVVDSRSHAVDRRLPLGTPSKDWQHLYSIVSHSLVDTDPHTGATLSTLSLGDAYELPPAGANGMPGGLSQNGMWLTVESFDGAMTHMLVVNTTTSKVRRKVDLPGRFRFDAVSDDGDRLYLIQYLNGKEYYVRLYDLAADRLDANIVIDKSDGNQAMTGLRLSGVPAPDGSMLFSMYVRESESPFIHALNLSGPFAFCLDLPGGGYTGGKPAMQWSLAMRSDGARLYAINGATGVVAEVDTTNQYSPQMLRTGHVNADAAGAIGVGAAVLSPDGKTLVAAGSSGLMWIDTSTLRPRASSLSGWHVSSLALSPDGKALYAVSDQGRMAEISMNTAAMLAQFDTAEGKPIALMRVAAA